MEEGFERLLVSAFRVVLLHQLSPDLGELALEARYHFPDELALFGRAFGAVSLQGFGDGLCKRGKSILDYKKSEV